MKRWERYAEILWPVGHTPERQTVSMSHHRWRWVANFGPKYFRFRGADVLIHVRPAQQKNGVL